MESPSFKQQLSPTKSPLFPASPERMNQQRLANSISMPLDFSQKASDVQTRIAFLNSLSRAGSPAPSQQQASALSSASAALQRAILGREEAESALLSANTQLSEAQSRERRISERLESLLEELQTTRERQAHERALFEKEVRKARKEAFRAGSMLVKVQEELKLSRGEIKILKDEVRTERESKERAKQESFERAYALAGMSEELQSLKDQLRATEANNQQSILDDLDENENKQAVDYTDQATCTTPTPRRPKRSVDALDILRVTDPSTEHHAHKEETPTKKIRLSRRFSNKENQDPETLEYQGDLISELKTEIKMEQRRRQRAEGMVHFMKMECQFKRCSCRIAESQGHKYVHDKEWDEVFEDEDLHVNITEEHEQVIRDESPATSIAQSPLGSPVSAMTPPTPLYQEPNEVQKTDRAPRESDVAFCEVTGTFVQVSPLPPHAHMHDRPSEGPLVLPKADDSDDDDDEDTALPQENPSQRVADVDTEEDHHPSYDFGAHGHDQIAYEMPHEQPTENYPPTAIDTQIITTVEAHRVSERAPITPTEQVTAMKEEAVTQTVPIQFESKRGRNPSDIIPGTPLTREEALAQIRARRGRTKSTTQRSVSANEATARTEVQKVPPSRRIPGMKVDARSEPEVGTRRDTAPVSRRY